MSRPGVGHRRLSRWFVYWQLAMEEALELLDLFADIGLEGAVTWIVRLLGLLLIVAGIVAYVVFEAGLLIAGGLAVVGLVLLVAPSLLIAAAELA